MVQGQKGHPPEDFPNPTRAGAFLRWSGKFPGSFQKFQGCFREVLVTPPPEQSPQPSEMRLSLQGSGPEEGLGALGGKCVGRPENSQMLPGEAERDFWAVHRKKSQAEESQ